MQLLTLSETELPTGGLSYLTPALVALGDTASLGPLSWSFGVGYAIGTFAYNLYWS